MFFCMRNNKKSNCTNNDDDNNKITRTRRRKKEEEEKEEKTTTTTTETTSEKKCVTCVQGALYPLCGIVVISQVSQSLFSCDLSILTRLKAVFARYAKVLGPTGMAKGAAWSFSVSTSKTCTVCPLSAVNRWNHVGDLQANSRSLPFNRRHVENVPSKCGSYLT